jgi:hypothetical protein
VSIARCEGRIMNEEDKLIKLCTEYFMETSKKAIKKINGRGTITYTEEFILWLIKNKDIC